MAVLLPFFLFGCAHGPAVSTERGNASWYGKDFQGRKTASGERFDMHKLTAAHRTFPMGTMVRVTRLDNQRSVVVRINDRGPYSGNRILDLSYEAAKRLAMLDVGTVAVEITPLHTDSADLTRAAQLTSEAAAN